MNDKKRTKLKQVKKYINIAKDIAQEVLYDEEDCLENMPPNLAGSEKCEKLEDAISSLEHVIDSLEEAEGYTDEAAE